MNIESALHILMPIIHIPGFSATNSQISKLILLTEGSGLQASQVGQVSFMFSLATLSTDFQVPPSPMLDVSVGKGKIAAAAVAVGWNI